jgi:cell division protein FtsI/penicillin-binding protein 2
MTGVENHYRISRKRIYFLFILFLIAFSIITYRLVSIQYLDASKYQEFADYQHMDEFKLDSKRGKILDRNGNELAISLVEKTVYANPQMIEDLEYTVDVISDALDINRDELMEKISDKSKGFVYLKRKIGSEEANKIAELNLEGIYIENECKRYYPQEELAAPVIGFTGTDGNGLYGIELKYESILRGVDGRTEAEKDVFGNIIPENIKTYIEPIDGEDVILTIDSQIQFIAERSLAGVAKEYNAQSAIAVVMNPVNGEILAMASYPGFDANNYLDYDDELYKVAGASFTYEPGSTFKIVNVSSALENGTVTANQVFNLPPSIQVGDRIIREIFRTGNIQYTTKEIIKHSSNVGAVVLAMSMGDRLYWEGIKKFGFGEITGVELPGEESGIVHDYKSWPASTIGALAIGQSISVTPLQLLRAACVIANDGYLINPTIIKEVSLGKVKDPDPESTSPKRIISGETASSVKDMMLAVVEDGTGTRAQIEDVKICGKTGTAEKVNRNGTGYSEGRSITSFIGFGPYEDPKIAVIVVVDEPQGPDKTVWGGTVAAPVFKEIMEFSLERIKVLK